MSNLETLLLLGFFFLGYGLFRIELVGKEQLKLLEQIAHSRD